MSSEAKSNRFKIKCIEMLVHVGENGRYRIPVNDSIFRRSVTRPSAVQTTVVSCELAAKCNNIPSRSELHNGVTAQMCCSKKHCELSVSPAVTFRPGLLFSENSVEVFYSNFPALIVSSSTFGFPRCPVRQRMLPPGASDELIFLVNQIVMRVILNRR